MHSKSNNREITTALNKDEIIRELFNFLSDRYQAGLEQMMIGSDFALDYVNDCSISAMK